MLTPHSLAGRTLASVSAFLLVSMLALPAAAQMAKSAPPGAAPAAALRPQLTAADLEAFLEGFLPAQIERQDIAGAVVVVVKDGKVLFGKGYGYADVKTRRPVSVDDTLFRPGSVSKLFTATAVMQLVEQGKLDLDRDVNDYIDFKLPATYSKPVTLRAILTHTPGFEEAVKNLFIGSAGDLTSLRQYLVDHLPARIWPPGTVPAYSNYGIALSGYVVERVSGEKFEDYVANHIYKPLGMTHATFAQPLSPALAPLMSSGYRLGSQDAKPYEIVQAAPAGSMAVSAGDIAKFMIAHLQDGRYGDAQILKPETAKLMHSRQYAPDPRMPAMCISFFDETQNGHTIVGHGGDTLYFHSHLHLILDANVGLFVSLNSAGRGEFSLREVLWNKFLDRYFPPRPETPPAIATAAQDAAKLTGSYISTRRGEKSILKAAAVLAQSKVAAKPDGTLVLEDFKDTNGQARQWREIAPMLYQDVKSEDRLLFKPGPEGRMTIFTYFSAFAFERAHWYENQTFNLVILIFTLGLFLLSLLLWPVAALCRRHYGKPLQLTDEERKLRRRTRLVALLNLIAFGGWAGIFFYGFNDIGRLTAKLDLWLRLFQILAVLGALGTLVAVGNALRTWSTPGRWWWTKLHEILLAAACLGFVWLGFVLRIFHFSLNY
jgi:CubicO group peptidase (beta-lactamase class C family)